MAAPSRKPATYEDILALPEGVNGEIIAGELFTSPRPRPKHARAAGRLFGDLEGPFDRGRTGPGGWLILFEPELHLGRDIVVPDLAGWRRERMPQIPDDAYFTVAPDWVAEVLSPSTSALDRAKKLPFYARENVAHVWIVDPTSHTIEVFALDGPTYRLVTTVAGDDKVRLPPFDAVELDLSVLWQL